MLIPMVALMCKRVICPSWIKYGSASEAEQKEFLRAFIERIELFPEKQKDGNWIRNIVFNFPVPVNGGEVKEIPLENETMLEACALLSRKKLGS